MQAVQGCVWDIPFLQLDVLVLCWRPGRFLLLLVFLRQEGLHPEWSLTEWGLGSGSLLQA